MSKISKVRPQPAVILERTAPAESSREEGGDGSLSEAEQKLKPLSAGPVTSPLIPKESPGRWQSESLLAESWSTMGDVDPEDSKSLDSNEGAALGGEENNSSLSDMVHLEPEEVEMLEEAEQAAAEVREEEDEEEEEDELQTSVLSVLGGEKELAELREELRGLHAPQTEELLVLAEEACAVKKPVEFMHVVPPMALPPLPIVRLQPPSTTSTPVPSVTSPEVEPPYPTQELHPPPVLAPVEVSAPLVDSQTLNQSKFSQTAPTSGEVTASQAETEKTNTSSKPAGSPELPALFCGGAALVAVVGVVAYGAIVYCKK
ncbi:histone H3.v1 [Lampris incognitus]|uniref:histone H3.v1 n=1 Tax=Lampris incognitus TaxID=2546036 RepID=UPI0024B56074|nr:histone H3.v1 [Lampris incognitus]